MCAQRAAELQDAALTERSLREEAIRQLRTSFNDITSQHASSKNQHVNHRLELSDVLAHTREYEARASDLNRA